MNARSIVSLLLGVAAPVLLAQERVLTIEESIAIGLENSKELHSSQMKLEYADAKAGEAAAGMYPIVESPGVVSKIERCSGVRNSFARALVPIGFPVILNNYSTKATLQQPLFTGWKLQSGVNSAEYTAEASKKDVENDKAELVYNIKSAYWNFYRAKDIKRVSDENVTQISSHLNDIESMFKQGMATTNDVLKVKVQLSNAKLLQSEAANNVEIAMISFNSTLGISLNTQVGIGSQLTPTTKEFPDVQKLLEAAFTDRPDLQGLDWRLKAAESGVTGAKAGWSPQIFLTGIIIMHRPNPRYFPPRGRVQRLVGCRRHAAIRHLE